MVQTHFRRSIAVGGMATSQNPTVKWSFSVHLSRISFASKGSVSLG